MRKNFVLLMKYNFNTISPDSPETMFRIYTSDLERVTKILQELQNNQNLESGRFSIVPYRNDRINGSALNIIPFARADAALIYGVIAFKIEELRNEYYDEEIRQVASNAKQILNDKPVGVIDYSIYRRSLQPVLRSLEPVVADTSLSSTRKIKDVDYYLKLGITLPL